MFGSVDLMHLYENQTLQEISRKLGVSLFLPKGWCSLPIMHRSRLVQVHGRLLQLQEERKNAEKDNEI